MPSIRPLMTLYVPRIRYTVGGRYSRLDVESRSYQSFALTPESGSVESASRLSSKPSLAPVRLKYLLRW